MESNINNKKLIRLASNLADTLPEVQTPSDVYAHLRKLLSKQGDYFHYLGAENFFKITIYIWCIKNFDSAEPAKRIFEDLIFVKTFYTDGEEIIESCDSCDARGQIDCENCDGSGDERCSTCDREGVVDCPECDGSGKDEEDNICTECEGQGIITCEDCDGSGEVECSDCGGDRTTTCSECDGDGEIHSDELNYTVSTYAIWDTDVINTITNSQIDDESFDSDLIDNMKSLKLRVDFYQDELQGWIDYEELYTLSTTTNPKLIFEKDTISYKSEKADKRLQEKFVG